MPENSVQGTVLGEAFVSREKFMVFLFVGHSNMAGRTEYADTQTHPRAWNYAIHDESFRWIPAQAPLHPDAMTGSKGGPGMPFLKTMVKKYPELYFGIIQNANSGGSLGMMPRSSYGRGGNLYKEICTAAHKVRERVTIAGVVANLGWKASQNESYALSFYDDYCRFIGDLRDDLHLPHLPFLCMDYERDALQRKVWPLSDLITTGIAEVCRTVPNTFLISTQGITFDDDHHFNYFGHCILAHRLASVIEENGVVSATKNRYTMV
jgi:hypothetical protein